MKIYKYYAGKVHVLEVRETAKMYICDGESSYAFDCRGQWRKDEQLATSIIEAIQEAINSRLTIGGGLHDRLNKINTELVILRKLAKENELK